MVEVALERHGDDDEDPAVGYVMADDTDPVPQPEPWAALLPVLDPTLMGWNDRRFLLGSHRQSVFDRNGNAGTTAWWDGKVVGVWRQRPDGSVAVLALEDLGAEATAALAVEADRLNAFLDGDVVNTVYPSPAMKRLNDTLKAG